MRATKFRAIAAIPVVAGALAGCGGSDAPPKPAPGKTVRGETETGMKMKVETFIDPAKDPRLKKLDDWRKEGHYPPVDYQRVTADNSAGQVPDSGREISFARVPEALSGGEGIKSRFSCDALAYEWIPLKDADNARFRALKHELCADGPPKQDGIAPGQRKVYYLVNDRTFAERGLRNMRVFGPRDVEFK